MVVDWLQFYLCVCWFVVWFGLCGLFVWFDLCGLVVWLLLFLVLWWYWSGGFGDVVLLVAVILVWYCWFGFGFALVWFVGWCGLLFCFLFAVAGLFICSGKLSLVVASFIVCVIGYC